MATTGTVRALLPLLMSLCGTCGKVVHENENGVLCDMYKKWSHSKCEGIKEDMYKLLSKGIDFVHWYCKTCNKFAANMIAHSRQ